MFRPVRIKIPKTASIEEIIEVINNIQLIFNPDHNDPEFSKWMYDHKDWLIPVDI